MRTRKRGRYLNKNIQNEIEDKSLQGWTPAQIFNHLRKKHYNGELEDVLPSQRTVQRVVKDLTVDDTSGVWGLGDSDGEDARLILDVLANVILWTGGSRRYFSKIEAEWVLKIRIALPDADPYKVWLLARKYMLYERINMPTEALDTYLAFTPWRSKTHMDQYINAVKQNWIDFIPLDDFWDDILRANKPLSELPDIISTLRPMSLLESPFNSMANKLSDEMEYRIDNLRTGLKKGEISAEEYRDYISNLFDYEWDSETP